MRAGQFDSTALTRKGCSKCTKRRITCDLGQPGCRKCVRRGLDCPGYDSQLRWVGGVATRGRLKGLQALALEKSLTEATVLEAAEISKIESMCGYTLDDLIEFYDKHVCRMMVRVDSGDNLFRHHILPLAKTNSTVRLAIAAVSAQHISITRGGRDVPEDARNEAVSQITRHINTVTSQIMNGHDPEARLDASDAEWILASMLVLSAYEIARSGASDTEFHRKAARSLINTLSTTECRGSTLFMSLKNKVSTFEIFASTTCFDPSAMQDIILPDPDNDVLLLNETALFLGYLKLLHEVTFFSRQRQQNIDSSNRDWKSDFEIARGTTLMGAGRLDIATAQLRRDFIRLVDIHYHAALLYVARCLNYHVEYDVPSAFSNLKNFFWQWKTLKAGFIISPGHFLSLGLNVTETWRIRHWSPNSARLFRRSLH